MDGLILRSRINFLESPWGLDAPWYLERCSAARNSELTPLQHFLDLGCRAGIAPNEYMESIQSRNFGTEDATPRRTTVERAYLALEMDLVKASGMFDAEYYLKNNPEVEKRGLDPLLHFCTEGWRSLRNPNAEFDVWWYWSCYLDPRQEGVNPVAHHALIGHYAGYSTRPPRYRFREGHQLDPSVSPRRICLFAGYDPDGKIDDYVIRLIRELGKFCDVYYLADCLMNDGELEKLRPYVVDCWSYRHGGFDFRSWGELAGKHVGWDAIATYDELLLVNDSAYLVDDLDAVFNSMGRRCCDWWGLQATKGMFDTRLAQSNRFTDRVSMDDVRSGLINDFADCYVYDFHVGSYFMSFRAPVISDAGFRWRITAAAPASTKGQLVRQSEVGLTQYLVGRQFHFDTFIPDLFPLHPVFTSSHFTLISMGFPLFKRLLLTSNHYNAPGLADWKATLASCAPRARIDEIESNLNRVGNHAKLVRSFAIEVDEEGLSKPPRLMSVQHFREADARLSKKLHWWAFPVDRVSGVLGGNERAVFEVVRKNPKIRKIVLTRWRDFQVDGDNVVVVPLRSPAGEHYLLRAGHLFVGHSLRRDVIYPVNRSFRSVVRLGGGDLCPVLSILEHKRAGKHLPRHRDAGKGLASPSVDILSSPNYWLPDDLRVERARLKHLCAGRGLLLYVVSSTGSLLQALTGLSRGDVNGFQAWLADKRLCLGIRSIDGIDISGILEVFRGPNVFACSARAFPNVDVVYRSTLCVVADDFDAVSGFFEAERPAFCLDKRLDEQRSGEARPGAGAQFNRCRDFSELFASLRRLFAGVGSGLGGLDSDSVATSPGAAVYGNARAALTARRIAF